MVVIWTSLEIQHFKLNKQTNPSTISSIFSAPLYSELLKSIVYIDAPWLWCGYIPTNQWKVENIINWKSWSFITRVFEFLFLSPEAGNVDGHFVDIIIDENKTQYSKAGNTVLVIYLRDHVTDREFGSLSLPNIMR